MRTTADGISIVSVASLVGMYVAAKTDFFRNFDPKEVAGYLAGHWTFWIAALALAAAGQVAARQQGRG